MNTTTTSSFTTTTTSSSINDGESQTLLGDSYESSSSEGGGRVSTTVRKSSNKMRAYGGAVGAVCATAMVALAVANGSASSFTGGGVTAAGRGVLPRRMAMLGKGGSASSSLKADDASVEKEVFLIKVGEIR